MGRIYPHFFLKNRAFSVFLSWKSLTFAAKNKTEVFNHGKTTEIREPHEEYHLDCE